MTKYSKTARNQQNQSASVGQCARIAEMDPGTVPTIVRQLGQPCSQQRPRAGCVHCRLMKLKPRIAESGQRRSDFRCPRAALGTGSKMSANQNRMQEWKFAIHMQKQLFVGTMRRVAMKKLVVHSVTPRPPASASPATASGIQKPSPGRCPAHSRSPGSEDPRRAGRSITDPAPASSSPPTTNAVAVARIRAVLPD